MKSRKICAAHEKERMLRVHASCTLSKNDFAPRKRKRIDGDGDEREDGDQPDLSSGIRMGDEYCV